MKKPPNPVKYNPAKFNILYNFISPVTGRVLATPGYVLVGDRAGIATPGPDLIDFRLNLLDLRNDFSLASSASYVIGFPNTQLPNAQVLSSFSDGIMINSAGMVGTIPNISINQLPDLTANKIWVGNDINRPTEITIPSGPPGPPGPSGSKGGSLFDFNLLKGGLFDSLFSLAPIIHVIPIIPFRFTYNKGAEEQSLIVNQINVNGNFNMQGNRIKNLAQSPEDDNDAVSAKWVWDLFNGNVQIKWQ